MKKTELISKELQSEFQLQAEEHDAKLTTAIKNLDQDIFSVGCELAIMRDETKRLWSYIKDPATNGDNRGCFGNWRDYARYKLGKMSTAKMYELISAHTLTCGINAVPTEEVVELGVKKAAQLARLPAKKRTQQIVEEAKHETVKEVTIKVNKMLDEDTPAPERKERLVALNVGLPQVTVDLINEVERDGMFMEAIRDGDKTLSLRAKLWHAVWYFFKDSHKEELEAASIYREEFLDRQKTENGSNVAQV